MEFFNEDPADTAAVPSGTASYENTSVLFFFLAVPHSPLFSHFSMENCDQSPGNVIL